MAPEQGTGQRYGKRIDLWAIGIIMFQILTGKHPFYLQNDNEKTYIERISKDKIDVILEENFEKWEFSELARCLMRRLLARGITDRYTVN